MKKSHYVFIGICIAYVVFEVGINYYNTLMNDETTFGSIIGWIIGKLIFISICYGIYLLIEWLVRKPKSKKAI